MRFNVAAVAPILATVCGCAGPELPAGWEGAEEIDVVQTPCDGSPSGPYDHDAQAALHNDELNGSWITSFRCMQNACMYYIDESTTLRFLAQPCDMHPDKVAKCACLSRVAFSVSCDQEAVHVEFFKGYDAHAGEPDPPTLDFEGDVVSQ